MARANAKTVENLMAAGEWREARALIGKQLKRKPNDHWLLTQLAVTYYEQGMYKDAMAELRKSYSIMPHCPLTLWNIAGVADALGKYDAALSVYSRLVESSKTSDDDLCWESPAWADNLKTDCVYRIAETYRHMGKTDSAANCYRQYIELFIAGINGMYPIEDAARWIRDLRPTDRQCPTDSVTRKAFRSTVQGIDLPAISMPELLAS